MFVEERHQEILRLLNENEKVKVKELSKRFEVTEDCIRKDLASMEAKNLLKRTYGGAVLPDTLHPGHTNIVSIRKDKNIKDTKIGQTVTIGRMKGNINLGDNIYKISSKKLNSIAHESINGEHRKVPLNCAIKIDLWKKILLLLKLIKQQILFLNLLILMLT